MLSGPKIQSYFPLRRGDVAKLTLLYGHHLLVVAFLHRVPPHDSPDLVGYVTSFCVPGFPPVSIFSEPSAALQPPFDARLGSLDFQRRFISLPPMSPLRGLVLQADLQEGRTWLNFCSGGRIFVLFRDTKTQMSTLTVG